MKQDERDVYITLLEDKISHLIRENSRLSNDIVYLVNEVRALSHDLNFYVSISRQYKTFIDNQNKDHFL
jgi:hypothetical protein